MANDPHPLPTPDDPWGYRGRRVVVTGAASGMGKAASEILVSLGAEVIGLDIQPIDVVGIAQQVRLDLAEPAAVNAAAEVVTGRVDALFNCAGIPGTADSRLVLAINFAGMRQLTERLIPQMPAGSAICCIGSTAAVNWPYHVDQLLEVLAGDAADPGAAVDWLEAHLPELGYAYDVSKEAVNVYATWRAIGLNELGIRINCINPGGTFTPASREFTKAVKSKDGGTEMIANWPKLMGRMARPDEQAWPMVFLNSRSAGFVNGATMFVDGGLIAGMVTRQHHPAVAAGMFWSKPVPSAQVGK